MASFVLMETPTHILNLGMVLCPQCGYLNSDSDRCCKKCNQDINTINYYGKQSSKLGGEDSSYI